MFPMTREADDDVGIAQAAAHEAYLRLLRELAEAGDADPRLRAQVHAAKRNWHRLARRQAAAMRSARRRSL
jgi:hypothetical protein